MPAEDRPPQRLPRGCPGRGAPLLLRRLVLSLAAAALLVPAQGAQDSETTRRRYAGVLEKKASLEREKQLKGLLLQMAASDEPWLLLDLADRQIRIYVRATPVKTLSVKTTSIEGERRLFGTEPPPASWADQPMELFGKSGPRKEPEKIVPKEPGSADAVDPGALTPEHLGLDKEPDYPSRYTLLFRQGVAVSLGGDAALDEEQKGWIRRAWSRVRTAVSGPEMPAEAEAVQVRVWVHLEIAPAEAQALYPSLPTGMRAMVRLPGDPAL